MTTNLPPRALNRRQQRHKTRLARFTTLLQDGQWHPWPTKISTNTANSYAYTIRQGYKLGPGYQAHVRQGVLYVKKANDE